MRGVEHYREAERLLDGARAELRTAPDLRIALPRAQFAVLAAQVHATLALADVTAETQRAGEWPT